MCGVAALLNLNQPASDPALVNHADGFDHTIINRMRDRLTHRGPDDAGTWCGAWGSIAHRRLSVIDPGPSGHQPMQSPCGRYILAYNGELYNDIDLRSELGTLGVQFRTHCDTETLLHALIEWGDDTLNRLRGMYAFVFLDTTTARATIARDPLGIKPLYHATFTHRGQRQLAVASEIPALLAHPGVTREPDPVTLSAYLSTIRTTLGSRTMFAGIRTLEPGEWATIDLAKPSATSSRCNWWDNTRAQPTQGIRQTIEDSVHRHLRTDVPMCALLSGGLDSAITATLAMRSLGSLHTYCAGARTEGFDDDFAYARRMAAHLGTTHHEIEVTRDLFVRRLPELVGAMGNPVSTPNEVAIHAVASALRSAGHIVTISGEGADELFGGYGPIMAQCSAHVAGLADPSDDPGGGVFHLRSNAWISEELKAGVLRAVHLDDAGHDAHLRAEYTRIFDALRVHSAADSALQTHLRFQRRMNLANLLQRLDTATMLAGVEGRTPFADIEVAIAAEALPMDRKYRDDGSEARTKIALREAFAADLPAEVVARPKASFPLPFQSWLGAFGDMLLSSSFARAYFTEQAIGLVSADPGKYWHMAWPMVNLTLWGQAWVAGEPVEADLLAAGSGC